MRLFAKFLKNLSGQCYGINENFANFYPDLDKDPKGIFGGPGKCRPLANHNIKCFELGFPVKAAITGFKSCPPISLILH